MRGGRSAISGPVVSGGRPAQGKEKKGEETMGSGAKIALVALLILMVVAVAKFVQNGKEDDAGPTVAAKKDAGAQPKAAANGPRLVDPKNAARTPGTGQLVSRQPISGVPAAPGLKTPLPGAQAPGPIGSQSGQPVLPRPPAE